MDDQRKNGGYGENIAVELPMASEVRTNRRLLVDAFAVLRATGHVGEEIALVFGVYEVYARDAVR